MGSQYADINYLVTLSKAGVENYEKFEELISGDFVKVIGNYQFIAKYYDEVYKNCTSNFQRLLEDAINIYFVEDASKAYQELMLNLDDFHLSLEDPEDIKKSVSDNNGKIDYFRFLNLVKNTETLYENVFDKYEKIIEKDSNIYEEWYWVVSNINEDEKTIDSDGNYRIKMLDEEADAVLNYSDVHLKMLVFNGELISAYSNNVIDVEIFDFENENDAEILQADEQSNEDENVESGHDEGRDGGR